MQIDNDNEPFTTLDGRLLVIASDTNDQAYMLSYKSPDIAMSDTPSGQRIDLPDRVIRDMNPNGVRIGYWWTIVLRN